LGHADWVAADEAEYVARDQRLAGEVRSLRANRAGLRARMAASPLCDIKAYVVHLEALYGRMWAGYCAGEAPRVIRVAATDENI